MKPTPSSGYQSNTDGTGYTVPKVDTCPDGYDKKAIPALKQKQKVNKQGTANFKGRKGYGSGVDAVPGKTTGRY